MLFKFLDGSFQVIGTVFGFTFWTVCTARTGQFKAVDPQYEQTIEGHKLVLSEFWHDRGERRPISSGDSTAYEYVL